MGPGQCGLLIIHFSSLVRQAGQHQAGWTGLDPISWELAEANGGQDGKEKQAWGRDEGVPVLSSGSSQAGSRCSRGPGSLCIVLAAPRAPDPRSLSASRGSVEWAVPGSAERPSS